MNDFPMTTKPEFGNDEPLNCSTISGEQAKSSYQLLHTSYTELQHLWYFSVGAGSACD